MEVNGSYGPYGGFSDPYRAPEGAGLVDHVEAMYNGQTYLEALDAAGNPIYQFMCHPDTGQRMYWADGTPMIERVPLEQRMAPRVRQRQANLLKLRLMMFIPPVLFGLYIAVVVFAPAPVGQVLQEMLLPVVAYGAVWGGAAFILGSIVRAIFKACKNSTRR